MDWGLARDYAARDNHLEETHRVMELVAKNRLPIRLSARPDFSDAVTGGPGRGLARGKTEMNDFTELELQAIEIDDRVRVTFEEQDGIWYPLFEKVA